MAKNTKLNKIYKSYAEICVPAVLYLVVGFTVVAIDFYYYTLEQTKTKPELIRISVKLTIIIFVTIFLNYICYAGYPMVSVIIMLATSGYLLIDEFRAIKERRTLTPAHLVPRTVVSPSKRIEPMRNAFDTYGPPPVTMPQTGLSETDYRLKQIVPAAQLIGLSTKNAYN